MTKLTVKNVYCFFKVLIAQNCLVSLAYGENCVKSHKFN